MTRNNALLSLAALQSEFLKALEAQQQIEIFPGTAEQVKQSLKIYRRNRLQRQLQTLQAIYPVCERLVGSDFFKGMAQAYIAQTPSQVFDLNDYGESFSAFIKDYAPVQGLPYLADLAKLEWSWHRVSLAPFNKPLDVDVLQGLSDLQLQSLSFHLPAESKLLFSPYPLLALWQVHQENPENIESIALPREVNYLLIIMVYQEPSIIRLTEIEWTLLQAIQAKQTLVQLAELNIDVIPYIQKLITQGWITWVTINNDHNRFSDGR